MKGKATVELTDRQTLSSVWEADRCVYFQVPPAWVTFYRDSETPLFGGYVCNPQSSLLVVKHYLELLTLLSSPPIC